MVKDKIHASGIDIAIYTQDFENEFISLTDIARYRNEDDPRFVIQNWMRNKNTIEFLGVWEELHNPNFNRVQFEAVMLNVVLFGRTAKQWKDANPNTKGNMRDFADLNQLLVLANLESYNSVLITQGKSQRERMELLHQLAVQQIQSLEDITFNRFLEQK